MAIKFEKVKHDINGNPRFVCHYSNLLTKEEKERLSVWGSSGKVTEAYAFALKKAKAIGGRKFHNKQFGGGIVFQEYESRLPELEKLILSL